MPPKEMQDLAKLVFATSHPVDVLLLVPVPGHLVRQRAGRDALRARALLRGSLAHAGPLLAFFLGWVLPFSYRLGRLTGRPPEGHRILIVISCLSLLAVFLERIVLVLPVDVSPGVSAYGASTSCSPS